MDSIVPENPPAPPIEVVPAALHERAVAVSLLFADQPPDQRAARTQDVLFAAARGELNLDGLLLARRGGEPLGTLFFVLQHDGTAFVWPPAVPPGDEADTVAEALLRQACGRIDAAGAAFGQCILEQGEQRAVPWIAGHGFRHLADLRYLQRTLDEPLPPMTTTLEAATFDAAGMPARFADVIERTYVGTRDCPSFHESRTGEAALASHRLSGEFDPARWTLFRRDDGDVGVLLLNAHPEYHAWEVVYVGVVPEQRGQGYGRALVLAGLYAARKAGCDSVFLAVDEQNAFARRVYDSLGFTDQMRRAVYVRWAGAK